MAKQSPDKLSAIEQAAHSGAYGLNPLPLPTDKQKESGNFKKGKFNLYGLRIAIEQPTNTYRTGIDSDGVKWRNRLAANYGYILGSIGNDSKPIDCFVGEYPQADTVYIVNQFVDGYFDEHKIMLCFPSEREAIAAYKTSYAQGWNGLHSIVKASVNQFKKWLAHGSKQRPVTKTSLPIELTKMQTVQWDANGKPLNTDLSTILYHIGAESEGRGLLLDAVTPEEFNADYAAYFVQEDYLDSLSVFYNKLNMTARLIANTMNKVGGDLQCTITQADEENGVEANPLITKPYKKYGVLNVSLVFTLSDAQTVTIVTHNPDSTPSKIQPHDMMVSWKTLLNKKDITAVVSPESGKDLPIQEIAKRIMQLANKNSAAFTKANQGAADTMKLIDDLSTEISGLESTKTAKLAELAVVQSDYEDWQVSQATQPATVAPVTSDFVPTHTYHDSDLGQDVYVMRNEDGNWQSADGSEYVDIDSEVEPVKDDPNFPDYGVHPGNFLPEKGTEPQPDPVVTPEPDKPMTDLFKSGLLKALKQKTANTDGSAPSIDDFALRVGKLLLEKNISPEMLAEFAGTSADKAVDAIYPMLWGNSQPTQTIDPVAKSNIEAANISAAIKKKAIAYLSANPTSHTIDGISPKSLKAIMESIKAALFAEIKVLSPLFEEQATLAGTGMVIALDNNSWLQIEVQDRNGNKVTFSTMDARDENDLENSSIDDIKNLFDSTKTLEDLKSWGFALPFDLDVKAFVANVIKPVVDEFLAKQAAVPATEPAAVEHKTGVPYDIDTHNGLVTYTEMAQFYDKDSGGIVAKESFFAQKYESKLNGSAITGVDFYIFKTKEDAIAHTEKAQKEYEAGIAKKEADALKAEEKAKKEAEKMSDDINGFLVGKDEKTKALIRIALDKLYKIDGETVNARDFIDKKHETSELETRIREENVIKDMSRSAYNNATQEQQDAHEKKQREAGTKKVYIVNSYELGKIAYDYAIHINKGANVPEPTPTPEPQPPVVETPTNSFDADIEALRGLAGKPEFDSEIDALAEKIDSAGLMEQYDAILADLVKLDANAVAGGV
jgi:hypothetical protein